MNKYKNGKIYKLVCLTTGNCYIGSTIIPLKRRVYAHNNKYSQYLLGKTHYRSSFKIVAENNFIPILITNYPCNSKKELEMKEQQYIEGAINCINDHRAHRSIESQRKDGRDNYQRNKESIKKYSKEYYDKNKEKICERLRNKKI